ncbi:MAG: YscO family type III secretion system apparatus protein [Desulfobacteraceae bacterium]|nr:YscO family type III secretion system apparatus protein [Desulfobacteraceae bacterium]
MDLIVKIRKHRENNAEKDLSKKKRLLAEAEQEKKKRRNELREFREWRKKKEESIFHELKEKLVPLKEISLFQHKISNLRQKEGEIKDKVTEAETKRVKAEKAKTESKIHYFHCVKNRTKIEEIHDHLKEQELKQEERKLENQVEEIVVGRKNNINI